MSPQDAQLAVVAEAVVRYLDEHPDAADTVEGIAQWWLPASWCVDTRTVQSALARLEAQGAVHRRILADQHELYSRQ
jgi:Fe2+ or Zn2+ uptake regulation protein